MTDLLHVAPDFDATTFAHIVPALERASIDCTDIVTGDAIDVAKRATVPPTEVQRLKDALSLYLHKDLETRYTQDSDQLKWSTISLLDSNLDDFLAGGIATGHVTEITGESATGKTQALLTLCLSVQLPAPSGLGRSALYITTEGPLQTSRLEQILSTHPRLCDLSIEEKPSLQKIHSVKIGDVEAQEHILHYQVPVIIERHDIGLLVIDSIAANFRAEFDISNTTDTTTLNKDGPNASDDKSAIFKARQAAFAARSRQLVLLGAHLRHLAQKYNLCVVVANQVQDRFPSTFVNIDNGHILDPPVSSRHSSPCSSSKENGNISRTSTTTSSISQPPNATSQINNETTLLSTLDPLSIDHQHRFTSGWGHIRPFSTLPPTYPSSSIIYHSRNLKSPSLGHIWTSQISTRIVMLKDPIYKDYDYRLGSLEMNLQGWKRWIDVVFSPWCRDGNGRGLGVGIEICSGGIRTVEEETS